MIAPLPTFDRSLPLPDWFPSGPVTGTIVDADTLLPGLFDRPAGAIECVDDPADDEDDLADQEDLAASPPLADEESTFDDFDDEFDDDFEEEENDPDWDHPDDKEPEPPPPGKGGGRKK
jgi:hypothetical protein